MLNHLFSLLRQPFSKTNLNIPHLLWPVNWEHKWMNTTKKKLVINKFKFITSILFRSTFAHFPRVAISFSNDKNLSFWYTSSGHKLSELMEIIYFNILIICMCLFSRKIHTKEIIYQKTTFTWYQTTKPARLMSIYISGFACAWTNMNHRIELLLVPEQIWTIL